MMSDQIERDIQWLESQSRFYAMGGGANEPGADVIMHSYASAARSIRTLSTEGALKDEVVKWARLEFVNMSLDEGMHASQGLKDAVAALDAASTRHADE